MKAMRFSGTILASALLGTGIATTAAIAQQKQSSMSALKGHNSNAPIDLSADRLEVQDRADRAIFAGNVHVVRRYGDRRRRGHIAANSRWSRLVPKRRGSRR